MDLVNACNERESVKGGYVQTVHLRPISHLYQGSYRRNDNDWKAADDAAFVKSVSASTLPVDLTGDGTRRMYPTGDKRVYVEVGAPQSKSGTDFAKADYSVATLATAANKVSWASEYTALRVVHAGHYVKVECELLKGFVPDGNLLAFPLTLSGLTLERGLLLQEGKAVGKLRDMLVYDADNPEDVRPIAYEVATVKDAPSIVATLPDLKGMTRPVVDPTFESQPDAAAGVDTYISPYNAAYKADNFGVSPKLGMDSGGRTMLRWSLQSIAAGASATSATLALFTETSWNGFTGNVYSVAAANGDWAEGTKDSATAGAGEPCWDAKAADGAGGVTTAWAGSAGMSTATTDYDSTAIGAFSVNSEAANTQHDIGLTASAIASWFGQASNPGLLIIPQAAHYRARSSDYATASYRPKLTVTYTTGASAVPQAFAYYARLRRN